MKKFALFALAGLCLAVNASAATITLAASFGDSVTQTAMSDINSTGDTQVFLDSLSYPLLCTGADASMCGAFASFQSTLLDSSISQDITLGANLVFRFDTGWQVQRFGASGLIAMTGIFFNPSDQVGTETPGFLNFSMPTVFDTCDVAPNTEIQGDALYDPGCSSFNASGATNNSVPEPGSMALMGLGLAGLGFLARRRKS